jgi:nucleoid-associated protein YgaU
MADRLEQLKQKYQSVLNMISQQQVRLQNINMEGNKLLIRGEAPSEDAKNQVWNQIKLVDATYSDLTADITVAAGAAQARTAGAAIGGQSSRSYTVKAGDSLSKISKQFYGNSSQYMKIFEANRDKLSNPDQIQPGQELVIPD